MKRFRLTILFSMLVSFLLSKSYAMWNSHLTRARRNALLN